MRRSKGGDIPFDALFSRKEQILYHLPDRLCQFPETECAGDGETYLAVQSSPNVPMWICSREEITGPQVQALAEHAATALARNPRIKIFCRESHTRAVRDALQAKLHAPLVRAGGLIAYQNENPLPLPEKGQLLCAPQEMYRADISLIARQFTLVAEGYGMTQEEALLFADGKIRNPDFFLWEDEGRIVSMAQIADRHRGAARINSVGTREDARGRGYAGMLVGALCQRLLSQGLTPMLYADADYPSSNRAYRKIGFEAVGELIEYQIEAK